MACLNDADLALIVVTAAESGPLHFLACLLILPWIRTVSPATAGSAVPSLAASYHATLPLVSVKVWLPLVDLWLAHVTLTTTSPLQRSSLVSVAVSAPAVCVSVCETSVPLAL